MNEIERKKEREGGERERRIVDLNKKESVNKRKKYEEK